MPDRQPAGLLARFAWVWGGHLGLLALGVFVLLWASPLGTWSGVFAAFGLYVIISAILLRGLMRDYPHARLGLCNVVTLFRATLVAGLAAVVPVAAALPAYPAVAWAIVAIAIIALGSDGVDGWAARRAGLVSRFGARFDMEVDSLFALILALIVMQTGKVGDWIIFLGIMRYLFVGAMWIFPWINRATPARFSAKLVCVIQIAALIALVAPVVTGGLATALGVTALALVIWSFGVDLRYLWSMRHT